MTTPAAPPPPGHVFGIRPWFPWPLSRWRWLTCPVRAERLAALRIGLALCSLIDVLTTYLPMSGDLFGRDSLGSPDLFGYRFKGGLRWSLLENVWDPDKVRLYMWVWAGAWFLLLVGLFSRFSALVCWVIGVSVASANSYIDNAGDIVRLLATFYLVLSPCGAAWSLDAWLGRRYWWAPFWSFSLQLDLAPPRRERPLEGPVFVYPWALCLLFVQMMMTYLFNGLYKASGKTWHEGTSLYYTMGDLTLARFSYAMLPVPFWMTKELTRAVLWWELLVAPMMLVPWRWLADRVKRVEFAGLGRLHVLLRWNRAIFLLFGASFHAGILLTMEIGWFAEYMLCLYLPLIPWERLAPGRGRGVAGRPPAEPEPAEQDAPVPAA